MIAAGRVGLAIVDNRTPLPCRLVFPHDALGRVRLVVVVQATLALHPPRTALRAEQPPLALGPSYYGDPATSSLRLDGHYAYEKCGTDVAILGHALAPRPGARAGTASVRVGTLARTLRISGARRWVRARGGGVTASEPEPFERMPLRYELAFGGWDRSARDPAAHGAFAENPVGMGFRHADSPFEEGVPLPCIEDPRAPLERYGQVVAPAGFGFVAPHWEPRVRLAGTMDATWRRERMPLLPLDFDARFFNAAAPGLVATPHLVGHETVALENVGAPGSTEFALPGLRLSCDALLDRPQARRALELCLDSVVIDADAREVALVWRASLGLERGPLDVRAVRLALETPRAVERAP